MTDTILVTLSRISCCHCGIVFGVPDQWGKERRTDRGDVYCPNGHKLFFSGKSEEQRQRERAERAEAAAARHRCDAEHQSRRAAAARGVVTKTKRRIAAGKCPCCKVKFADLHAHMGRQHPEYADAD